MWWCCAASPRTWALSGPRVGYALGALGGARPDDGATPALAAGDLLQLEAITACSSPEAVAEAECAAKRLREVRAEMVAGMISIGVDVVEGCAPFVLFAVADAELMRKHLDGRGIAVRRCGTFVGPQGEVPARGGASRLAGTCRRDGRGVAVSAALSDIVDVLEAAYPPRLAQDWDSVGLVCGDPSEKVETVTIAVDATAAVVAEVPDRGLLLAHHPLLLRGVDTVAASTAKGALLHQMILYWAGRCSPLTRTPTQRPPECPMRSPKRWD